MREGVRKSAEQRGERRRDSGQCAGGAEWNGRRTKSAKPGSRWKTSGTSSQLKRTLGRLTLRRRPRLVGRGRAVVGCVGGGIAPVQGGEVGLAIARVGLAVRRGHWSVLVYIHLQFIPKTGRHTNAGGVTRQETTTTTRNSTTR